MHEVLIEQWHQRGTCNNSRACLQSRDVLVLLLLILRCPSLPLKQAQR